MPRHLRLAEPGSTQDDICLLIAVGSELIRIGNHVKELLRNGAHKVLRIIKRDIRVHAFLGEICRIQAACPLQVIPSPLLTAKLACALLQNVVYRHAVLTHLHKRPQPHGGVRR